LATGIASFGHVSGVHYQNKPEWEDYCGDLENGSLPLGRALKATAHQRLVRELILQLKRGSLDGSYFLEKYGVAIFDEWNEVWTQYEQEGYLQRTDGRVELSRQGLLRADSLLPAFFEPEHRDVRYT
ncbi:MAG: coproporphyrinogen III oxidase, partial [Pirellulales bacterium]|nr:coproporphyrinogen III oxidase [Pirellulales bacterium]